MSRNKTSVYSFIMFGLCFFSCQQEKENNIYDYSNHTTKILGHRAYGLKGFNDTIMDNTLTAIIKAIEFTDGVELDIQMSKDKTLWLYHDTKIFDTDSNIHYIPKLTDKEILDLLSTNYPGTTFNYIEEVFQYFNNNELSQTLSLDVKSFYSENCFNSTDELNAYMQLLGERVIYLSKEYYLEDQIMIESDIKYLLDYFKKYSAIKTFLLGYSNFNHLQTIALEKNYTGVSHNFNDTAVNSQNVTNAHKNGLKIQLWTPNTEEELKQVLSLYPDFIQTDNVHYFNNKQ
ncbi:MAG: glycerophosphodiester phosphodiesterase [Thiohalospira sp.]